MSGRQLFRTPMAIGLLSGALAGAVKMMAMVAELRWGFETLTELLCLTTANSFLSTTLLLALPSLLVRRKHPVTFLICRIAVFVLFLNTLPYYLISKHGQGLGSYFWHFSLGSTYLFTLATGIFQGITLSTIYGRSDLKGVGVLCGALGSLPSILLPFIVYLIGRFLTPGAQNEDWPSEAWAAVGMATILTTIAQGVIAAVPFERATTNKSAWDDASASESIHASRIGD